MNIGKIRSHLILISLLCPGILLLSCDNENEFTLGDDFIESSTHLSIVDTFMVDMSTVIQDSIVTSGTKAMLIGNYQDTLFGNTRCSSFFRFGLPESASLDEDDIYDSVVLVLQYSQYYFGDTNIRMGISVHRLNESIELHNNGYLYNVSSLDYEKEPLGSGSFWPAPKAGSANVNIRLNDDFGLDLFNKLVGGSDIVKYEDDFLDYFKGVALLADEKITNTVVGFKAEAGSPIIRLYTHRIKETSVESSYDFPMIDEDHQFNRMHYDFSNTLLKSADNNKTAIPSVLAGNKAYVLGYQKIMTKLRFPSLPDLILNEKGVILKAELVFYPEKFSYYDFSLPERVILYETNRQNRPLSLLYNLQTKDVLTATLDKDLMYREETHYTFDITNFITSEFSDSYFDIEHGLLISLYDNSFQLNLERIVIEARNPAPKLKIYYLTY